MTEFEARLLAHEQVCEQRYANIQLKFDNIDDRLDGVNARLKRIEQGLVASAAFIITLLLALVLKIQ